MPRLRRVLPTAALALACAALPAARAAFSDAFHLLRAELAIREAGLQGNTDPGSLLQLRAIGRSYDAIDRSATLAEDCRAAGRVASLLLRAFPSEFEARPVLAADLSDFLGDAWQRLVDRIYLVRRDLQDRALGLRPETAFRVRRAVDACDARLGRAFKAGGWAAQARHLAAAAEHLARGTRIADADTVK
jgi:hypothetical protein